MAQPPKTVEELLEALEDRAFKTYKNRVIAFERIQARSRAWNTALIALATATTIAALGLLVDDKMYGDSGATFLAACSILSLAASLVVSALDYPGRAVRMESNYKETQSLATKVEAARVRGGAPTLDEYTALCDRYDELLRHSENHTTVDNDRRDGQRSLALFLSSSLTLLPYATLVVPGWLIERFTHWVLLHAS